MHQLFFRFFKSLQFILFSCFFDYTSVMNMANFFVCLLVTVSEKKTVPLRLLFFLFYLSHYKKKTGASTKRSYVSNQSLDNAENERHQFIAPLCNSCKNILALKCSLEVFSGKHFTFFKVNVSSKNLVGNNH